MHLLIPFASVRSEAAQHALRDCPLPHLSQLLQRLEPGVRIEGDEYSLSPPHERAMATAWGWQGEDGALPFAAHAAQRDGIAVGHDAWGLITPVHWLVGRDHITLTDPEGLQLTEAESRAVFEAVRDLFESEGMQLVWAAPTRWYLRHEGLQALPCASLDRVFGRNVDGWLQTSAPDSPRLQQELRRMRRLQNEFQMLLYPHPVSAAREEQGLAAVNSFWLSGCGRAQTVADDQTLQVDMRLRHPALHEDWAAWSAAWRALDTEVLALLVKRVQAGESVSLTLCGERHAQQLDHASRSAPSTHRASLWQRLRRRWSTPDIAACLETL